MTESGSERDEVERLAEEFLERQRRGERPTIEDYARAYPDLADDIRELFPAITMLERAGTVAPPVLGDYRLLREIGRGGMGVVYEAIQISLNRHVALKVLPASALGNPTYAERFQREARAAGQLHHSNIVPVFGVGEDNGVHFYAMQFIEGRGLDAVLLERHQRHGRVATWADVRTPVGTVADANATGPIAAAPAATDRPAATTSVPAAGRADYLEVARTGLQVADALAYAHGQGILHRDIKPSNLLVDGRGKVWVTDFGLAKAEGDVNLTHTGDFVGTLRYMAPERFKGESDPRCDIYSLGTTLYELLALRPAFNETDRARLMRQVLDDEPQPLRLIDARIPRDLETIVHKAIAKELRLRYSSASEMADDLRSFVEDRPIRARRSRWPERVARWSRRNPRMAALSGLAALFLLVIVVGGPWLSWRLWQAQRETQSVLWDTQLARAEARRMNGMAGRRFEAQASLDAAQALPTDEHRVLRMRNEQIAVSSLADLGVGRQWPGYPEGSAGVCCDRTLTRYARSDNKGNISIRRLDDDREIRVLPGSGYGAWTMRFSPDGLYLAAGYQKRFKADHLQFAVWDCVSGNALLRAPTVAGCGDADFGPDGKSVAYSTGVNGIAIVDLSTADQAGRHLAVEGLPTHLAFHPDGRKLAIVLGARVEVRDVASWAMLSNWPHTSEVNSIAWHSNGTTLATASGNVITTWDLGAAQHSAVLLGHENIVTEVTFNGAGDLLASKAHDGTVRLWDVANRRELVRAACAYTGCAPLHFGPDDRQLGLGSDGSKLWLWNLARGDECRTMEVRTEGFRSFAGGFSPDGRWFVASGSDGFRIWDATTGREAAHVPVLRCANAVFAADGQSLLTIGPAGMERWSLFESTLPIKLDSETSLEAICQNVEGSRIAVRYAQGPARVLDPNRLSPPVGLGHHDSMHYLALSRDGKLAATGPWYGSEVNVWDTVTGKLLRALPVEASGSVAFDPAGEALLVGTEKKYVCYDLGTWEPRYTIPRNPENVPGVGCFASATPLLAVRYGPSTVRLLEPATGRPLAELATPSQRPIVWHALSPDGNRLAVCCTGGVFHLWDLAALRGQLAPRGLDWQPPALAVKTSPLPPLAIALDAGRYEVRGDFAIRDRAWEGAIAAYRRALELAPDRTSATQSLVTILLLGPPQIRDAEQALQIAKQGPDQPGFKRLQGIALCRLGRFEDAKPLLATAPPTATATYFLAICHHHLGARDAALTAYADAERVAAASGPRNPSQAEMVAAARRDAEAALFPPAPK